MKPKPTTLLHLQVAAEAFLDATRAHARLVSAAKEEKKASVALEETPAKDSARRATAMLLFVAQCIDQDSKGSGAAYGEQLWNAYWDAQSDLEVRKKPSVR